MSEYGKEQEEAASAPARWLPLNSRRLTKSHLQLIAETLGLYQQIEGKLLQMQHEPGNVQVSVEETTKTELRLSLEDESGVFQTCGPISYQTERLEDDEMEHLRGYMQDELDSLRRMGDELKQRRRNSHS